MPLWSDTCHKELVSGFILLCTVLVPYTQCPVTGWYSSLVLSGVLCIYFDYMIVRVYVNILVDMCGQCVLTASTEWNVYFYICQSFGDYSTCVSEWVLSKFNGTSTPKGSYRAKTGDNGWNVNSNHHSLSTALCESIRYQAKSEQNVRQDLIPRVRHGRILPKNNQILEQIHLTVSPPSKKKKKKKKWWPYGHGLILVVTNFGCCFPVPYARTFWHLWWNIFNFFPIFVFVFVIRDPVGVKTVLLQIAAKSFQTCPNFPVNGLHKATYVEDFEISYGFLTIFPEHFKSAL